MKNSEQNHIHTKKRQSKCCKHTCIILESLVISVYTFQIILNKNAYEKQKGLTGCFK